MGYLTNTNNMNPKSTKKRSKRVVKAWMYLLGDLSRADNYSPFDVYFKDPRKRTFGSKREKYWQLGSKRDKLVPITITYNL